MSSQGHTPAPEGSAQAVAPLPGCTELTSSHALPCPGLTFPAVGLNNLVPEPHQMFLPCLQELS